MTQRVPMTPSGYRQLKEKLKNLRAVERPAVVAAIEEARERHLAGIPIDVARSGIPFLDKILNGGLRPGTLTVLAARPGIGKTAFMLDSARKAAKRSFSTSAGSTAATATSPRLSPSER